MDGAMNGAIRWADPIHKHRIIKRLVQSQIAPNLFAKRNFGAIQNASPMTRPKPV
jgi:hypothetical protein